MRTIPRRRRYVSPTTIAACRPLIRFDARRDAYVLRAVGQRLGPVLRVDRRRGRASGEYSGPERRDGLRRAQRGHGTVAA